MTAEAKAKRRLLLSVIGASTLVLAIVGAILAPRSAVNDLEGIWLISAINDIPVNSSIVGSDQLSQFELKANGDCRMPTSTGAWTGDGSTITLHIKTYDGQTKEQFAAELSRKFPGDASMQKIAAKEFEDIVLTLSENRMKMTAKLGSETLSYVRARTKPAGNGQ